MNWPTSQDYNEAVQDPGTSFADPDLTGGDVALNALGLPIPRSGNFADVYEFTGADGRKWALKCFTRKVPGLKERYARIDEHLTKARLPFTVGFQFLPQGIRVRGEWYPLLKMEWVEGFTLNDFVARNLDKPHHLHALMQMWAKLTARVRDAGLAHADLQHGNVLLVPGATPQKLGLKLIDYDGMWVPALAGKHSGEVGHPNFQHPLRLKDRAYDGDVDRFPHLVIAAGLRAALVGGKAVWDRFDNGDNLLFKEADLRDPANAPVFRALWALNDPVLRTLVGHIALSAGRPLKQTPWLDQVLFADGGPKLTADQERQVCALLGVTAAAPAGAAAAPAAVERAFNVFEFLDEDEAAAPTDDPFGSSYPPMVRRKPAKKSKLPLFVGGGVAAAVLAAGAVIGLGIIKKPPTADGAVTKTTDEGVKPSDSGPPVNPAVADKPQKQDGPPGVPIGVAGLPAGPDFLFIRQGDPAVYRTVNGSARKAAAIGRNVHPVHVLAVTPDGTRALAAGEKGEVRVWPLRSGDEPATAVSLEGHTGTVRAGAVSPDGRRAVTISTDETLIEWDLDTGKRVRRVRVPGLRAVAFLKDGRTVLLGTEDQSAELWNLDGQKRIKTLPGHKGAVVAVAVHPADDRLFTADKDGMVYVWTPDGRPITKILDDRAGIAALAVSADGRLLACGGPGGTLRVFDAHTYRPAESPVGKAGPRALAFRPGGTDLVAGLDPDPILINLTRPAGPTGPSPPADTGVLTLLHEADVKAGGPYRMAYRPDGKYFWVARGDGVAVGDGVTGREIKVLPLKGLIDHACFGPGTELYVVHAGKLLNWDFDKGKVVEYAPTGRELRAKSCWRPFQSNRLLVPTQTGQVLVWDVPTWKEVNRITAYPGAVFHEVAPYPGGSQFVAVLVARGGPRMAVYGITGGSELFSLTGHSVNALTVARLWVSPNGRWIVGVTHAGDEGKVVVWDGRDGKHVHTLSGLRTGNLGGGFSPGGDHFICNEYTARRLDIHLPAGRVTDVSAGQKPAVAAAAAWAADRYASVDVDDKVRVWRFEVDTTPVWVDPPSDPGPPDGPPPPGSPAVSPELSDTVTSCVLSSDGKKVFAATRKGVIHVLDAATGAETSKIEASAAGIVTMALCPKHGAVPDRLYVLDENRHVHTIEGDKGAKVRDADVGKLGKLPPVSGQTQLVSAPAEAHLMLFDPVLPNGYSWVPNTWSTPAIPGALLRPTFRGGTKTVTFSADGTVGAAATLGQVLVWRHRTGQEIRTIDLTVPPKWIGVAAGAGAVAVADPVQVQAWKYEAAGSPHLAERNPHGGQPYFAAATGNSLVTAGADRRLRVWDLRTGKDAGTWQMEDVPSGVAASADGRTAVVWSAASRKVTLWALVNPKAKRP